MMGRHTCRICHGKFATGTRQNVPSSVNGVLASVGDDTYQTWYKIVGDLASGAHPLVVLHGGPGISHEYMTPLAEIHNKCNIPVIFYDQIGIGKSIFEGVAEKPREFWTVDLFMESPVHGIVGEKHWPATGRDASGCEGDYREARERGDNG
ncbi:hypothetical protein DFJ58DRAFT_892631 [Suillus subalutaceus]|uniref:uncharacterized protein n=1 Tax=Suillus subalutaceus TaxID=48586 RepID=UPI001B880B93|nr:uncharacterized protein DFJ58DRAFT_892631 [Suillus subalutaceus]KAG1871284.1 hypothetical protein DFJ58DRAFT_892631 [Suillus subalutaceus]